MPSTQHAFTLFELLITLALISILSTSTYPTYTHHLLTARRHHAEIILTAIASHLENYHSLHDNYRGATLTNLKINTQEEPHYQFIIKIINDQRYLAQAIPKKTQTKDPCETLTLDEIGKQNTTSIDKKNCWR